jgi:hypothetical protein
MQKLTYCTILVFSLYFKNYSIKIHNFEMNIMIFICSIYLAYQFKFILMVKIGHLINWCHMISITMMIFRLLLMTN